MNADFPLLPQRCDENERFAENAGVGNAAALIGDNSAILIAGQSPQPRHLSP